MRRAALVTLALLGAAARIGAAAPPDVVLVTLDTVRADRMGFLGSPRGLTPNLDALAKESLVFERASSQAPLTTVSHATILSGTYPPFHTVQDFGLRLPGSVPYLPDLLKASGYRTAAFVGSLILDPKGPIAPGFDRGFEVYDAGFHRRPPGADPYRTKERRGAEVVARALRWLDQRPPGPLFLWVHLYDAHDPYDPPAPFAARFKDSYDGEIAAVDAAVGDLLAGLRARRLLGDALVVVASDHGEGLGDHGEATHGVFLYDATIHVPLLVRRPRAQDGGRRIAARVSLADVAPTVLAEAGIAAPPAMQGRSLLGLAGGGPDLDRPSYAESEYPRRVFGWSALFSWRAERFVFVQAPRPELYDLRADPGATRNLAVERPAVAQGMAAQMEAARRAWAGQAPAALPTAVDPGLVERLASLGYASGGGAPVPGDAAGVDAKDKIGVTNLLHDASLAAEDGRLEQAIPLFERVVATDPQVLNAQLELGLALARRQEWSRALAPLRAAVARMPDFADARFTLGLAYASVGQAVEAVGELEAALVREPRHYPANLLLGRILSERGEAARALPRLERAVEARPDSAEARSLLADVYERLGRTSDAARERARVREPPRARPPSNR